ncbi:hypothetical protein RchiOBHm_Chr4g0443801 [Rosa chinensis]|uniref:Uncharacterized protein n=1 Tax=Rosa chinensis TaxID=74649 RepID=A0A2P6R3Y9_ROSCH|nr:hypothetical protein RchiOBHm_Chr4g0443801 [Rosa chinensis]
MAPDSPINPNKALPSVPPSVIDISYLFRLSAPERLPVLSISCRVRCWRALLLGLGSEKGKST